MLVASGYTDITPKELLPLAGFAARKGNAEGIADALEINLVAIKDEGQLVLLYSIDTFFAPDEFVNIIADKYGLGKEQVWICASHTHFAPSLDPTKPLMGKCDTAYYEYVKKKLLDITDTILKSDFEEGNIEYTKGSANLNVNRRKKILRPVDGRIAWKTLLLPNYNGEKDTSLHCLKFISAQNKLIACIWNYACHPVHAFKRNSISAEYIGNIRRRLRAQGNSDLVVGFLQGFAGNIKADITTVTHTRGNDELRYMFQLLPKYVAFPSEEYYEQWLDILWASVSSAFVHKNSTVIKKGIKASYNEIPLNSIIGDDTGKRLAFRKLELGDTIVLAGINAEVVTEYRNIIKEVFQGKEVIGVGYMAGASIYLPTDAMLKEKGYEVEGFKKLFHIEGQFKPSLNKKIAAAVAALNNG